LKIQVMEKNNRNDALWEVAENFSEFISNTEQFLYFKKLPNEVYVKALLWMKRYIEVLTDGHNKGDNESDCFWFTPNIALPDTRHNGQFFAVKSRMKYEHEKDWEYNISLCSWEDSEIICHVNRCIPHDGKRIFSYDFSWIDDIYEGQQYFEVICWRPLPAFLDDRRKDVISFSNPFCATYNFNYAKIKKKWVKDFNTQTEDK